MKTINAILSCLFNLKLFKLPVYERVILLEIINSIGFDFLTKKVVNELENKLSFSGKELSDLKIKLKDGKVFWDSEYGKSKYIVLDNDSVSFVSKLLKELENKGHGENIKELIKKFK